MKFLLSLALKNILRYKRRTVLTFLVMSFGIAFYIVMVGMVEGYKTQSVDNFIRFETGHFKVRSLQYDEDAPYSPENFFDPAPVLDVLGDLKNVTALTFRLKYLAEADNGVDSVSCVVTGIDPGQDPKVFNLTNYFESGGLKIGGAVIGQGLSDDLGLGLGDFFYITFKNGQGVFDSVEVEVAGVVNSGDPLVNSSTLFVPLTDAQKYLNLKKVSEVALLTDNLRKDREYGRAFSLLLPQFRVDSWRKLSESVVAASQADQVTTYAFVIFIVIIALVGIINTMLMSVMEKKREIGTLKALGMEDRDVRRIFLIEGMIIGGFGGILGMILGSAINWYFVAIGYDMTAFLGRENSNIMAGIRLAGVLKSTWHWPSYAVAILLSVVASIPASYFPAKKATELQPVDCLKIIQ